jgi:hypothetical protein
MALGLTQAVTETSTRNLPGGKGWPACKADLTTICELIVQKMWEPIHLTTLWASTACYRGSFSFLPFYPLCEFLFLILSPLVLPIINSLKFHVPWLEFAFILFENYSITVF